MPWKETQKMDQRTEFALKSMNTINFRELCREYGISTKTGYKWKQRFVEQGLSGLHEQSRRPRNHPTALSEQVVCDMVRLKLAYPHWGPRKIQTIYERKISKDTPSESSFKRVLEAAGLTQPRKRRERSSESGRIIWGHKVEGPNDVWSVDFKGWWVDRSGVRVEPLTVRDQHSRMVLEVRAVENSRTETIQSCFERLFERHGLPRAIRSDNGPPFASVHGLLGLSRLSAWWLALGIGLERGRPGCPQDNGAHERMHLDIRRELQAGRMGRDQAGFDLWRNQYNHERPHEALGMKNPADVYRPSQRPWQGTPQDIDYGSMESRRVKRHGAISFEGDNIRISSTLGGWSVGLSPQDGGLVEVWFAQLLLGHIDPKTSSFRAARPGRPEAKPNPQHV